MYGINPFKGAQNLHSLWRLFQGFLHGLVKSYDDTITCICRFKKMEIFFYRRF